MTSSWSKDDSIELISYLDGLLEWDQPFFHEFMSVFTEHNRESIAASTKRIKPKETKGQKYQDQVLDYLDQMYKKGPQALDGITVYIHETF